MSGKEIALLKTISAAGFVLDSAIDDDARQALSLLLARGCVERAFDIPRGDGWRVTDLGRVALVEERIQRFRFWFTLSIAALTLIVATATLVCTVWQW